MKNTYMISCICLFFFILAAAITAAQEPLSRGSIPEILLRPARGETPRYPVDTVIGELGRGRASVPAYSFAGTVAAGLVSARRDHPALVSINPVLLESYLSKLASAAVHSYRLGGGREEADGSVSFLVRFMGREFGITGELYIRYKTQILEEDGEVIQSGSWVFDDLLLENAKSHDAVMQESSNRLDLLHYERFF